MIKVTIAYRKTPEAYPKDESYLVDTGQHDVAVVTAMTNFGYNHSDAEHDGIVSVHTSLETSVLQPVVLDIHAPKLP